ncbi:MAG: hypothetical protein DWC10_01285 [Candidatus Poseidoniales archaeon]|nr:MAG: hypothetical protein DWC10_01285 [Candidatus Poseidoniales archaeon]
MSVLGCNGRVASDLYTGDKSHAVHLCFTSRLDPSIGGVVVGEGPYVHALAGHELCNGCDIMLAIAMG